MMDQTNTNRYRTLARLLVGREPELPVGDDREWLELVQLAHSESVAPLLHRALAGMPDVERPAQASEVLAGLYRSALHRSLVQRAVRQRFCRRLAERSIPVLILKGAALALTCYDDPPARPMLDIDVLVPPSRLEEAACCLVEDGFQYRSGSLAAEMRGPRGHVACVHAATETAVEIHWELKGLGPGHEAALPEIWSGARPAGFDETAKVMRLGHTLVHLCAHMLFQHKWTSLQGLFDLHRALLATDGAEAVVARDAATRWGLVSCTALALLHVRELFGMPLPTELEGWASEAAPRGDLQARVASLALVPGAPEMPHRDLLDLLAKQSDKSLISFLFPPPERLRRRLGLSADDRVSAAAYVRVMAHRLRNSPAHVGQLWRFWRSSRATSSVEVRAAASARRSELGARRGEPNER
jgi:hypothetical protein